MYISIGLPLLLCLIGAAIYLISTRQQISEIGRLIFAAGIFALAFALAGAKMSL
jgi:Na+/phosphate symporter